MSDLFVSIAAISQTTSRVEDGTRKADQLAGVSPSVKRTFSANRRVALTDPSIQPPPPPSPLLTDLVRYYALNGNADDSVSGMHGISFRGRLYAEGDPTPIPPGYFLPGTDGRLAFSMTSDGSGVIELQGNAKVLFPSVVLGTVWSVSMWVSYLNGPIGNRDLLLTQSESGFGLVAAYGLRSAWSPLADENLTTILGSDWTHLGMSYDGTTLRYYYNGDPDGSEVISLPSWAPNRILDSNFDRSGRNVLVQDVGLWSRCLMDPEFLSLFNGGNTNPYPF